jgi:hypothetical protein
MLRAFSLPCHLPRFTQAGGSPSSCAQLPLALVSARLLLEWLLALFSFYECGSPKSEREYSKRMGLGRVSSSQHSYANYLVELSTFCRLPAV